MKLLKSVLARKASLLCGALGFVAGLSAAPVTAAVVYNYGTEFSSSGSTTLNQPFLTVEIENNGAGGVTVSSTFNGLANTEYLAGLYFNIDPFVPGLSCSGATSGATCNFSSNNHKADGHPYEFDLFIAFPESAGSRFETGDSFSLTIAGVAETAFNARAEDLGYFSVARARSLGTNGTGSGWFYSDDGGGGPGQEIPEPAPIALMGVAMAAAVLFRRRRDERRTSA